MDRTWKQCLIYIRFREKSSFIDKSNLLLIRSWIQRSDDKVRTNIDTQQKSIFTWANEVVPRQLKQISQKMIWGHFVKNFKN